MLTLKLKDYQVEFSFTDYFSKKIIHSESFDLDDAEQIALDLLKMIKEYKNQIKIVMPIKQKITKKQKNKKKLML